MARRRGQGLQAARHRPSIAPPLGPPGGDRARHPGRPHDRGARPDQGARVPAIGYLALSSSTRQRTRPLQQCLSQAQAQARDSAGISPLAKPMRAEGGDGDLSSLPIWVAVRVFERRRISHALESIGRGGADFEEVASRFAEAHSIGAAFPPRILELNIVILPSADGADVKCPRRFLLKREKSTARARKRR